MKDGIIPDDQRKRYILTPQVVRLAGEYHSRIKETIDEIFEKELDHKKWANEFENLRYELYWMARDLEIHPYVKKTYETTVSKIIQIIRGHEYEMDPGDNYE